MINSCMLFGGCRDRSLMRNPLPHFGQTKLWNEGDRDAARSFCLLRFSFAASCLSASNSEVVFLTDEHQLSRSEASYCHNWWLIPTYASCLFSWFKKKKKLAHCFIPITCIRQVQYIHPQLHAVQQIDSERDVYQKCIKIMFVWLYVLYMSYLKLKE